MIGHTKQYVVFLDNTKIGSAESFLKTLRSARLDELYDNGLHVCAGSAGAREEVFRFLRAIMSF